MKLSTTLLTLSVAVILSACTQTRYAVTSEADDVYYSSSDKTAQVQPETSTKNYAPRDDYETSRRGYSDSYDEDDFYFSRRVRRFHQPHYNSWRYFDPYFSNDLYYVMGTNSWDRWNGNGWYSWNRPRFGASMPICGPSYASFFGSPFRNSFNYYNPWVSSYFGYDPFFGYASPRFYGNPGFGGFGFGSAGYWGGGAYSAAYYGCPTYGSLNSYNAYATYSSAQNTSQVIARRRGIGNVTSQTAYQSGVNRNTTTLGGRNAADTRVSSQTPVRRVNGNRAIAESNYLRPKTNAERNAVYNPATTRPSRTAGNRTYDQGQRRTYNNGTTRRRSTSNRTYTAPRTNRTVTRPSNRTYSTPSNRSRTYSTPSRTTSPSRSTPSYNRSRSSSPSSSPSRSSSTPSRSAPSQRRPQ